MARATGSFLSLSRVEATAVVGVLASVGLYATAICVTFATVGRGVLLELSVLRNSVLADLFQLEAPLHAAFSWAAMLVNPLLWAGWFGLLTNRPRLAGIAGGFALLFGLFVVLMWFGQAAFTGAWVWLWLASMAVTTGAGAWKSRRRAEAPTPSR
jgi:hypothetical protein